MGELRTYFVEGLEGFVNFHYDTPCPKLPARLLLDDESRMLSLNIKTKGEDGEDCDLYTMKPYPLSHHIN